MKNPNFKEFISAYRKNAEFDDIDDEQLKDFAEKLIKANSEYYWEANRKQCVFCYKPLTSEDHEYLAPHHFHSVCKDHLEFADHFQIRLVQERLGLPTADPNYQGFFD